MQAVIYDFDGVLVDSVKIKQQAFYKLFLPEGDDAAELSFNYHMSDNRNRFEVVNHVSARLGKDVSFRDYKLQLYGEMVVDDIVKAEEIPGAEDLIRDGFESSVLQFIASGTPHIELREIVKRRGWSQYITESFGTPVKKEQHIDYILKQYDLNSADVLFIGDMMSDYRAAQPRGLYFLARTDTGEFDVKVPVVKDFQGQTVKSLMQMTTNVTT